jgi:hypothetical protein
MAGLREFVVQFGTEEQCIEHFAGATYLPVPGVANVRHRGCRRARGCTNARPATGRIGDRWNGVSPDANRPDQVVSRRLYDGPR